MKQRKKNTSSNNSIKFPIWIVLVGLLSFFVVGFRVCELALNEEIDGINIQSFAGKRNSTTKILPAERGTIYDVNGNVLAQTVSSYTLIAYLDDSRSINSSKPQHVVDIEYTATELARVTNIDYDTLVKNLSKKGVYQTEFGPNGKGLTELQKDAIKDLNLPGIDFMETQKRYYPYGDFLSYTLGYAIEENVTLDDGSKVKTLVGKMGIEEQYDDILRGENGFTFYQIDRNGYKIAGTKEVTVEAVDGSDIYLSIDANVQLFLEQAIDNMENKNYSWDWYTILVADADTGAVLGSASNPSFDPNKRNITNWLDYNLEPFEPGSTMKIWTYMAAMENSNYDGSTKYKSGTFKTQDGTVIGDHDRRGWGMITYDRGFALSSNTGIIDILRNNITRSNLNTYFSKLGFGSTTGVSLPREKNGDISFRFETEYYNAGFGQGISTTPIQNIKALTSIANDGMLLQPFYVDKIVDSTGRVTYNGERNELYRVASKETTNKMKDLMEDVICNNGKLCTGSPYYMKGYKLIAKTGSAQVSNATGYDTGEVIKGIAGMFPKDDPEIIFYVASKKPNDGKGGSIKPMTTLVKEIVTNISSYYEIYNGNEETVEKVDYLVMDNYLNKKLDDVITKFTDFGINPIVIGDGNKIVGQYPSKNISLTKKDMVILITNDDTNIKIPDFTGYSLNEVKTILSYLDISYEIEGSGYVYKQSIDKDTLVGDDMTIKLYLKDYYVKEDKKNDK